MLENSVPKKVFFWSFHTVTTSKLTIFCSLESFDSAKECKVEKRTNYKSKVQKTIRFLITFFKIHQVFNQDILKVSLFEPKFLQLVRFRRDFFIAAQILSQKFYHSPDFETTLQRVQFWIDNVKLRPTSSQFFTTRQILIRDFYSVSVFEMTFLPPPLFLNRESYKASDFRKTLILGEQISLEIRLHKIFFWCQYTS